MNKKSFAVLNPSNGLVIAELDYMSYSEAHLAIEKAKDAFIAWKSLLPKQRSAILEKWYELLVQHREAIAHTILLELGKLHDEALAEVDYANAFVKYYAEEVLRVTGESSPYFKKDQWFVNILEPIGVVAAITPWNFPAAMITKKIAPALAAGCAVVLKPSEETPLTAIKIRKLALEAGVPEAIFTIVYGDFKEIGRAMLEHDAVKMISFTGSIEVGKYLMKGCAASVKKVVLELGGNAPCIITQDADLQLAVKKTIIGKLRNSGQACTSPNRIFVHEAIIDKFIDLLKSELENNQYPIGPLINQAAKAKAEDLIADAIACGGKILYQCALPAAQKSALYFAPVILGDLNDQMRIIKEEVFAPIFSILSFSSNDEVVARANSTEYGLAAYLFTSDLKAGLKIAQSINFGVIGINDTAIASDQTIHGGFNQSGLGREGGKPGLMEYYENKFIIF